MTTLKKEIGLFGGISILAGIMIGSGIFVFGSSILERVGFSLGLSLLAWLLGGILTLVSALTYAELGTLFPETGGYYVYLKKAYGKKVAFLSGLMNFVLSSSGSIALLALAFSEVLSYIVPLGVLYKWIAGVVIVLLSVVNYLGVKAGTWVQKIFLVAKLIPIFGIIVVGLFMGTASPDLSFTTAEPVGFFQLLTMIGFGVVGTLWAYEGWTNLNTVAGEMKDVKKDLPKALSISTIGVSVIYLLFIFSLYRILGTATTISLSEGGAVLPIPAMMTLFGETGMRIVFFSILISIFGSLNGSIMVFPRVYYAMAEDQVFFKAFSKVNDRYKTPGIAIIGSGLMALVLLVYNFQDLLTFVVFGGLIFNTLIFISIYIFRKRSPELERPYKVIGYPVIPALAILGMLLLIVSTLVESLVPSLIGFGVLVAGYFLYDIFIKVRQA
ncbi:APC family permease [Paracholeplasma manati]|uniref:APC family permease n=1 Tax=Paracholeplasma manati TaxID=591373 RepID=UPI002407D48A|nr:amino acid permease [Paracholeplasma manati]